MVIVSHYKNELLSGRPIRRLSANPFTIIFVISSFLAALPAVVPTKGKRGQAFYKISVNLSGYFHGNLFFLGVISGIDWLVVIF